MRMEYAQHLSELHPSAPDYSRFPSVGSQTVSALWPRSPMMQVQFHQFGTFSGVPPADPFGCLNQVLQFDRRVLRYTEELG